MLRSFNATIDADITESKLAAKLIQKEYEQIKKQEEKQLFNDLDQDSSSGANTSGMHEDESANTSGYDSMGGQRGKSFNRHNQFEDF